MSEQPRSTQTIYLKDLVVMGRYGVTARERSRPQRLRISVELTLADATAGASDELEDTLDWSALRRTVIEVVEGSSFHLIERLAQTLAARLLADRRVRHLTLTIDKLDAFENGVPGVKLEIDNR